MTTDLTTDPCLVLKPPPTSHIRYHRDEDGEGTFTIPRVPFGAGRGDDIGKIVFGSMWLFMLFVFGFAAATIGPPVVGLCLIPFAGFGIAMWRGLIVGFTETQELHVGSGSVTVVKTSVVSNAEIEIPFRNIRSIDVQRCQAHPVVRIYRHMRFVSSRTPAAGFRLPTIEHGAAKSHFAEGVSEEEARWLVDTLKAVVLERAGKTV